MGKKEINPIVILVSTAVGLLLMIVLVASLATQTQNNTSLTVVSNETLSIASARGTGGALNSSVPLYITNRATGYEANGDVPECMPGATASTNNLGFSLVNASGTVATAGGVDYTVKNDGTVYVNSTGILNNSASNTTKVTYDYCGNGYVASDWGRGLLNVTLGLLVVGILVFVVIFAYKLLEGSED